MGQYQPAQISTGRFHRETFTGTIFMRSGRPDFSLSGTEAGLKPASVKNAPIIQNVREMECITGMRTKKMY
jgi:hypothetical protein